MAKPPIPIEELHAKFGPHPNDTPPGGWQGRGEAERLVKTHCCFCGQQCGIQLKVRENKVIGFEPWEEFPFNKGKLCPKGVKRYMQGSHPDRLLSPLKNVPGRGFEPIGWDEALSTTVREIQRIQKEHGPDAFAMLSGVSLTNEKSYLVGKFARLALQTAELDYNGRLCMVSAGTGNKKAFGIDRAANYWEDILLADVILCAGTNVAECSPITTDYIWRARDRGAKLIMIDPRVTPMARTCDLHLPVRPGADSALLSGILRVMIEEGLVDEGFIRDHTSGWEEAKAAALGMSLEDYSAISGVLVEDIIKAGKMWGEAKTSFLLHARGIEHHTKGVDNVLACINLVLASGRIGRPGCGYGTITGQGNGQGGREHGHKCDQLPGNRDIENPEHRAYIASVWGIEESDIPGKGHTAQEIMNMIHSGEIKGLLSICFNPLVSLPDAGFTTEALNRLEHYTAIDFFLNETAHHADIVLAGSLHEEEEGTSTSAEGRVIRIRRAVDPPGEARTDTWILLEIARRLGRGQYFDHFKTSEDIFNELRVASKGGTADYYGITYERIEQEFGVFWPCPEIGHPGTPRLFEESPHTSPALAGEVGEQSKPGGRQAGYRRFFTPDGKAHFHPTPHRPSAEEPDEEYPVILTTGRVVSHYLSGTQTRRIGGLVDLCPDPYVEIHPTLAAQYGIEDGQWMKVESRRGSVVLRAKVVTTIRPDTIFIPYHWPGGRSANNLTNRALDPLSKIPEFKKSVVRISKAGQDAT
ncbi:MAG TPA: molybdopterin oxidoreductase family protein [Fimbriimonadaceae bacterium]|nr:molybdopterin oxidoreductase family protein [Fimbriimonadaceae bacterium]HRJ95861.1 molybdopterin oxidoreductase family protein [Fimbriimonadaceae bacterium]